MLSLKNFIISRAREKFYRYTEPYKLAYLRMRHEKFYGPDEPSPHIFIYTPTYNRADLLRERAIASVLAQTYTNFTYLIVGDCCTDHTAEMMRAIKDPRVHFFNLKKRGKRYPPTLLNHWFAGPVWAANYALTHVHDLCTWIVRIDDDDIWTENHLQDSLQFALTGNYEFVTTASLIEKQGVRTIVHGEKLYGPYFHEALPHISRWVYNPNIGSTNTVLYRSYLKYFLYNPHCWRGKHNKPNDVNLFHRLGVAGVRMGYIDKVHHLCLPRLGEDTIGSEAYKIYEEKLVDHFKFRG